MGTCNFSLQVNTPHWVLTAIRFSPIRCEATVCCPLVASFCLMLTDTKPCGEGSLCWWVSLFACDDLHSSCRTSWFCCGACISIFCAIWLIMASTRYIATRIASMFCLTLFSCLACSSTSSMAECHPLWACSFATTDVPNTYWCVLAMFFLEVKLKTYEKQYFWLETFSWPFL